MKLNRIFSKDAIQVIYVFLALVFIIAAIPIAKGLGDALGYSDPQAISARAELTLARAAVYQEVAPILEKLPQVVVEIGESSLQIALAVAIILIAIGALALLLSISWRVADPSVDPRHKAPGAVGATLPPRRMRVNKAAPYPLPDQQAVRPRKVN